MKVGVTGANGFIGSHVTIRLAAAGHTIRALIRDSNKTVSGAQEMAVIPNLDAEVSKDDLRAALDGLDVLVHLAARVHVMGGGEDHSFTDVNVTGSAQLMEAAADAGIQRMVFMSSVKASGERSSGAPLSTADTPTPEDAYGRSKLDAEARLSKIAEQRGPGLVILRPTFVYGWPAAGNFQSVLDAVSKGVPLPLAGIRNRRDMIYVGNLADAVRAAIETPDLGRGPYFLSDGEAISSAELFRRTACALARPSRLFYVPVWMLRLAARCIGRRDAVARLTENLEVDSAPFRRDAGWQAPYNMQQGLDACAEAYHASLNAERETP